MINELRHEKVEKPESECDTLVHAMWKEVYFCPHGTHYGVTKQEYAHGKNTGMRKNETTILHSNEKKPCFNFVTGGAK